MAESSKLSEEKLFECLKSLNVPVRMSDLKTPTNSFIIRVFYSFLKDFHINIANPILRPFAAMRNVDNPELVESVQVLMVLSASVNEILKNVEPLNITLQDIIAPKPKRTKKILNYIIIFWNNYLRQYALFQNVQQEMEGEIQEAQNLRRKNEELIEKYHNCIAKLKSMKPNIEELQNIVGCKAAKVKSYENQREAVIEKYQQLKEKENEQRTQISNVDIRIATVKEKLDELDQLIISSPEKLRGDLQKLKDLVKEVEIKIQEKDVERKERKKSCQSVTTDNEEYVKIIAKQQEMCKEAQVLNEAVQNLGSLCAEKEEEKKKLNDLVSTYENIGGLAFAYDQKVAKINAMKKNQIDQITETHEMMQSQMSEEKKLIQKSTISISVHEAELNKEIDALVEVLKNCTLATAETENIKIQYASQMQSIQESFGSTCEEIVKKTKQVFGSQ